MDSWKLGSWTQAAAAALEKLHASDVLARMARRDHTLWKPDPTEISNRLGWLDGPQAMEKEIPDLERFAGEARSEGWTHAVLLGMGGSSLAPEVFAKVFGVKPGYAAVSVLDTTDPVAIAEEAKRRDPQRTLYVVSTKSGGTVETFSLLKFFYNRVVAELGRERAGRHFVAITDPASSLADAARELQFRRCFLNDPNIGGRYSALSFFGLVPAALLGVDLRAILERARVGAGAAGQEVALKRGGVLAALAAAGRDKLTFLPSPRIAAFGAWAEQLVAESLGKEGKGIVPVDGEVPGGPEVYGRDRVFVQFRLEGDAACDALAEQLAGTGHPLLRIDVRDPSDVGREFFQWELAVAVAGHCMNIHPFDQPNVESAKVLARKMLDSYKTQGALPTLSAALSDRGISVYGDIAAKDLAGSWKAFLAHARAGNYLSLQAYLPPSDQNTAVLRALQRRLRDKTKLATTMGYGPRFLHSTGQLHKGGGGGGLFIQITCEDPIDLAIPDEAGKPASAATFGILKAAQALGDRQALIDGGRKVVRFHLRGSLDAALQTLHQALN